MIYLMRHGELNISGKKKYIGQADIPLNEKGIAKANQWQKEFDSVKFDRIISSDLSRTKETAKIIAGKCPCPIEEEPAFREIDLGNWDGKPMAEIKRVYPEEWEKRGKNIAEFRPPGGESFRDLQERSFPALSDLTVNPHKNILIVAHAGVNRVLLCKILGMPLENLFTIEQNYSCLNLLKFNRTWRVAAINQMPAG